MTFDDAAGNDFAVMYVVTQYQKKNCTILEAGLHKFSLCKVHAPW